MNKITIQQLIQKLQWNERGIELEVTEVDDQTVTITLDKTIINKGEEHGSR
jgi:hypothetical protein